MAQIARIAVDYLMKALTAEDGLAAACAAIGELPAIQNIAEQQIAADLNDKAASITYPNVCVYCDKVTNSLTEKFRTFSGTADLNIEVRVSHEHTNVLHAQLHAYVEAVASVLGRNRGTWAPGVFYAGVYEASFGAMKRGGRNYIQSARVHLQVHVSAD
jgi:hypothetical protein